MIPQRFKEVNTVMRGPDGMKNCADLHCFQNDQQIISAWRPTPEELVRLNLGEPVWLSVIGQQMPPVWIGVDSPFMEIEKEKD